MCVFVYHHSTHNRRGINKKGKQTKQQCLLIQIYLHFDISAYLFLAKIHSNENLAEIRGTMAISEVSSSSVFPTLFPVY